MWISMAKLVQTYNTRHSTWWLNHPSNWAERPPSLRHSINGDEVERTVISLSYPPHVYPSCRYLTQSQLVVIAPPIRFSVVEFSENRGNHVKVSTSLGLLLAHLGYLRQPVDLLQQERYTTCSSLLPPKKVCIFSCEYTNKCIRIPA